MSIRANIGAVLLLAALAGCSTASVTLGPDSDPRVARELLTTAARNGPVRLEVNALPRAADGGLTLAEVANQAARGIQGANVSFDPSPAASGSARLVLLFDPPADIAVRHTCVAASLPAPVASGPTRLQALFCDGTTFIADVTATTTDDTVAQLRRLVWRTTGRLFPDDYEHTFGLRQLGWPFGSDDSVKP